MHCIKEKHNDNMSICQTTQLNEKFMWKSSVQVLFMTYDIG